MKNAKMLAAAMVTFASLPLLMAQQVNTQVEQSTSVSAAGKQANESTSTGASAGAGQADAGGSGSASASGGRGSVSAGGSGEGTAEMRPVTGELESKLDSKTSKAGDRVVLKTREKIKTADGVVIPKGSRLIGHVTEVQAHEKGHAASQMGLAFDHAELKGGESIPIRSMIEGVQPSAAAMASSSMASEETLDTPMGGGAGAARGGGLVGGRAGGGGLLGGPVNTATSATGRVGSDLDATAGSAVRSSGSLGGEATGTLARGVGSTASGAGSLGARATGVPGVMLNGDATGAASGMLSASNGNVHLDSGTQMVLGVAAAR